MKSVLSIILWVFAPMLTPYGLQIGEVKTNNQTIKIMKMNFNNPAWLQGASNVGGVEHITRFVFVEGQNQLQLSSSGSVVIESMQDGEIVRETYEALSNTPVTINADSDTEVVIYGAVTKFCSFTTYPHSTLKSLDLSKSPALTYLDCGGCKVLTSLDLSKNTALTHLNCYGCAGLTSLDLSKSTALTFLDCSGCTGLMLLDIQNTSALNDGVFVDQGVANLTTLQVAGTSTWAYEQVVNWLNGDAPSGGTILVDENTPQDVITAATGVSWTVEYVDAA